MAETFEQDIILDADGKPVFSALETVRQEIAHIQKAITQIMGDSKEGTKQVATILSNQVRELQQAMGQIRTLSQAKNSPGSTIQDLNNNKRLARDTVAATEYGRTLSTATTAAEGLRAKLNQLDKEAAARGKRGLGETFNNSKARENIEAQIKQLRSLDAELTKIDRKASRTSGDFSAQRADINAARKALETSVLKPGVFDHGTELAALTQAQDRYTEALNRTRIAQAESLRLSRTVDRGSIKTNAELYARDAVATSGYTGAQIGAQLEKELALQKFQTAETVEQKAEALKLLEIKRAQLAAVEALVRAEDQVVNAERRAATEAEKTAQRKLDQEARQRAVTDRLLSSNFATGQIESLGADGARIAAKSRILLLEEQLKAAEISEQPALAEALALERARTAEIERQIRAKVQEEAQDARANRGTVGGRVKTAATNTALYGVVAGGGYAAFNFVQQQLTDMIQLEDEFVKLQAIANATDQQLAQLKGTIYEIGASSRFSLLDLAKISQTLAQAGVSSGEMDKVLRSVTTLATASGSTPDEAVNLVTSALGSFQLQATEAARVADLMTSALNRTKLTVGQVGQAIQYVGATAFEQNISLEQLLATVGAIAQAGVKSGSTIGTGFRQFLVDLQNPSDKLMKQLDALNIKASEVDVSVRGLPAVLETLRDKGFGAGQAYAGLETRAAAFYLTAKNNVDVMDDLQLAFATSGAAAIANERAMNSLTAQWQRFKNIIGEGLAETLESSVKDLQHFLQWMNDRLTRTGDELEARRARIAAGQSNGGFADTFEKYLGQEASRNFYNKLSTGPEDRFFGTDFKLGDLLIGQKKVSDAAQDMATNLAESTDKVNTQRTQISELEKEYQRLVVQKGELINNDKRSAVETANLTARFDGLALYLDSTKTRYQSLTDAVLAFTAAQTASLNSNLAANNSNLAITRHSAAQEGGAAISAIRNDPSAYNQLTAAEKAAFETVRTAPVGSQGRDNAVQVLSTAAARLVKVNTDLGTKLNTIVQSASTISTNTTLISTNNAEIAANSARATKLGLVTVKASNDVQALITQLGSADREGKDSLAAQANAKLDKLDQQLVNAKPRGGADRAGDLQFIRDQRAEVASARQQIKALQLETDSEKKARKDAEREAAKRPLVTDADVARVLNGAPAGGSFADRIKNYGERSGANQVSPKGARGTMQVMAGTIRDPGYGVKPAANNSIEEIDRVGRDYAKALLDHYGNEAVAAAAYNWGVGNVDKLLKSADPRKSGNYNDFTARLPKETKDYVKRVTGLGVGAGRGPDRQPGMDNLSVVGLEEAQIQNKMTTVRTMLANAGIEATVSVDRNKKRIVVSYQPGTRFTKDRTDSEAAKASLDLAQDQLTLDQNDFKTQLKAISKSGGGVAFDTAVASAQDAAAVVAADLRAVAEQELAAAGQPEGSPKWKAKMAQVDQEIEQNTDSLQSAIADGISKTIAAQLKAAESAFTAAMADSEQAVSVANAQVSGLDYFSNSRKTPDFVKQLASDRASQAAETRDRMKVPALGNQIVAVSAARDEATAKLNALAPNSEGYVKAAQDVADLTNKLTALQTEQASLQTALAAGSQIPTTIAEGARMAMEAYASANGLANTFAQDINLNMTSAIEEVNGGLTDMFTNIMNGSQTALGAFGSFAKGIMQYVQQLAAKLLASKILGLLFKLGGAALGGGAAASSGGPSLGLDSLALAGRFNGGPAEGLLRGGQVSNGSDTSDSVTKRLAKGEWVINKKAVDSVGPKFMAQLNRHGADALSALSSVPQIAMTPKQEMAVYVVAPGQKPQLGKNDILLAIQEDILSGGETKKLIKYVGQGG